MIENHLFEDENIVLDFTPSLEKLTNIYKYNVKMSIASVVVFVFVFGLIAIVAKTISIIPILFFVFLPVILFLYFCNKNQINNSKEALVTKFILTDKRCIVFNTKTNTIKYILLEKIDKVRQNQEKGILVISYPDDKKITYINYNNVENVDSVIMTIIQYKN